MLPLLCKWLWWLGLEEDWLWKRVLVDKYEMMFGTSNAIRRPHGRSLWKGIVKHLDYFKKGIGYEIGEGATYF